MGSYTARPDFVGKNRPTEPFGFFMIYLIIHLSCHLRYWGPLFFIYWYIYNKIKKNKLNYEKSYQINRKGSNSYR